MMTENTKSDDTLIRSLREWIEKAERDVQAELDDAAQLRLAGSPTEAARHAALARVNQFYLAKLKTVAAVLNRPAPPTDRYEETRAGINSLLLRRGVLIVETLRGRDRDMAYQVGMLLGEIARILDVNDPSLPSVPLKASRPAPEPDPR